MIIRLIHIINICTLLFSTIGVATYSHYCQDKLKSIAFFINTIKPCCLKAQQQCASNSATIKTCCAKKKKIRACCSDKSPSHKVAFTKKNCCLDKKAYYQSDAEITVHKVNLKPLFRLHSRNGSNNLNFIGYYILNHTIQGISYSLLSFFPPPQIPLYIWYQSFLC